MRDTSDTVITLDMILSNIVYVVFLALKITQVVDWSWWIVFLPVLIAAAFLILVMAVAGFVLILGDTDGEIN